MDEVLRKAGLFQGVDPDDAEALGSQFEIFEAPRGTTLFHEGEPGDSLYVVLSGKVKLGRRSSDGRENLVAVMGPADLFGELSLFDPGPRTSTAVIVTDARIARLPKAGACSSGFRTARDRDALLQVIARRLRRTNTMLADLIFVDVPGRVAKALLELAPSSGRSTAANCVSRTTSRRRSWPSSSAPRARR